MASKKLNIVYRSDLVLILFWKLTIAWPFQEPKKPQMKEIEGNLKGT